MSENKLTPRDLACFKQVADVIGEYAAEIELQKVLLWDARVKYDQHFLYHAFSWRKTRRVIISGVIYMWTPSPKVTPHLPVRKNLHLM